MKRPLTLEQAARVHLRGERHVSDPDDEDRRQGMRTPKVTLPRVRWLERPGPEWVEPPQPKRARKRGATVTDPFYRPNAPHSEKKVSRW